MMSKDRLRIKVIDYGAGNLRSILNACHYLGYKAEIAKVPSHLHDADRIILPGVGNFGKAMKELEKFKAVIKEKVSEGVAFLGICLGIQVILEESEEAPNVKGFGLVKGRCLRFPSNLKVPHMGWNTIDISNPDCPLLKGIKSKSYFYFVHSYYPRVEDESIIVAKTNYGVNFPSIISDENLFATQFHPEKSGKLGLKILKNFLEYKH